MGCVGASGVIEIEIFESATVTGGEERVSQRVIRLNAGNYKKEVIVSDRGQG